jgi:uncharacterized membrane protein YkvA (DUF1232 family)
MAARLDRDTVERILRDGMRRVKTSDVGKAVRRSPALRRLVRGPLADMAGDLNTLVAMLKDYASGDYRSIPQRTILAATVAVLYVLNPFDLVPDFLPGVGLADDAAVVAFVLRAIQRDIHDYRTWTQKALRRLRQVVATI